MLADELQLYLGANMKPIHLSVLLVWVVTALGVSAAPLDAETRALLSRVQSMSHGYYPPAEWEEIFDRLASLRGDAQRAQRLEDVVELDVIESMIHGDAMNKVPEAISILQATLKTHYGKPVANLKRVYVQLAALYARQGDERAVSDLIEQFQKSPHFDPVRYPYSGGTGPGDPLLVTRPRAGGRDSITVTTMQRFRNQARFAPGRVFPDLEGIDGAGRSVRVSDYRGTVLLVDFWVPDFVVWERDIANVVRLHRQYRPAGFEIIGVPLALDMRRAEQAIRQHSIGWPQWRVDDRAMAQLGIFGDTQSFLLDRQGVIVGRNLRGAELAEALRQLL